MVCFFQKKIINEFVKIVCKTTFFEGICFIACVPKARVLNGGHNSQLKTTYRNLP